MKRVVIALSLFLIIAFVGLAINKIPKYSDLFNFSIKSTSVYTTPVKIGNTDLLVEVVNNPISRAQGLSGRKSLCNACGMLFDFVVEDTYPIFWMKDMNFPIDIIWINDENIVGIEKNVQPEPDKKESSLTKYTPPEAIDQVLEVNAGFSDKHALIVKQSITLPQSP